MSGDVSGSEDEGGRQALLSIQVRFQLLENQNTDQYREGFKDLNDGFQKLNS